MLELNKIHKGDCLELMKEIPDNSVDMILCDLPYGVLNKGNINAKWDSIIPLDILWKNYTRILKNKGIIILTSQGMFTAELMMSNKEMWRYNLIWKKGERTSGFLNSKRMPLRNHEDICIFYKNLPTYNPQMQKGFPNHKRGHGGGKNRCYGEFDSKKVSNIYTDDKYPKSVINIEKEHDKFLHPTQKPVALFEYLIKTYSNEGDLILDNCAGSGTTGVACINTKRNYILIEKDEKYFEIAEKRLSEVKVSIPPKDKSSGILDTFL